MTDTKHTEGPWQVERESQDSGYFIYNLRGMFGGFLGCCEEEFDPDCLIDGKANAARIVACVNALEGLSDKEVAGLPDAIEIYAATRPETGRWELARIKELEEQVSHLEGRISEGPRDAGDL